MKTLYLMRHAKANWATQNQDDMTRELTPEGIDSAHNLAEKLKDLNIKPEFFISSEATRAFNTSTIIAEAFSYPKEKISVNEKVYIGGIDNLMSVIHSIEDQYANAFLVGHNPFITQLAHYLAPSSYPEISTCSVYAVEFNTESWGLAEPENGTFLFFEEP